MFDSIKAKRQLDKATEKAGEAVAKFQKIKYEFSKVVLDPPLCTSITYERTKEDYEKAYAELRTTNDEFNQALNIYLSLSKNKNIKKLVKMKDERVDLLEELYNIDEQIEFCKKQIKNHKENKAKIMKDLYELGDLD